MSDHIVADAYAANTKQLCPLVSMETFNSNHAARDRSKENAKVSVCDLKTIGGLKIKWHQDYQYRITSQKKKIKLRHARTRPPHSTIDTPGVNGKPTCSYC